MTARGASLSGLLSLALLVFPACQGMRGLNAAPGPGSEAELTLTRIVASLEMHLHEDTYRLGRPRTPDGRDVYAVALWQLDRLAHERARSADRWENVDIVIEFARARALERQRRFAEAAEAYEAVAQAGSFLAGPADSAARVMRRFAESCGSLSSPLPIARELDALESCVGRWRELSWRYRRSTYAPLVLEQLEAWEMLRVDRIARSRSLEEALQAAAGLVERHRDSSLYARHLIRLGDLYALAARRERLRAHAGVNPFDSSRYESLIDQAFAAYELAGEQRQPTLRQQAETKIAALLAYHQGMLSDAR